ncbi:hypothetical protein ACW9I6_00405 [Pseudomonas sp. SDO5522_S412]
MAHYYGFISIDGSLAFASYDRQEARCWFSQYGGWYQTATVQVQNATGEADVSEEVGLDAIRQVLRQNARHLPDEFHKLHLKPGQYYPRIWRGISLDDGWSNNYDQLSPRNIYGRTYLESVVATESLLLEVKDLFRVVEPNRANDLCYGHRLRELLILLCTEVEACWAGVLRSNQLAEEAKGRYSTKHYVRVGNPLRLTEWKVELKDYPGRVFQPFKYWNVLLPTASINWYDAYNKVKHDREGCFSSSTYRSVLDAAAALHILQVAQWGPQVFDMMRANRFSIFYTVEAPIIHLSEAYLASPVESKIFNESVCWRDHRLC